MREAPTVPPSSDGSRAERRTTSSGGTARWLLWSFGALAALAVCFAIWAFARLQALGSSQDGPVTTLRDTSKVIQSVRDLANLESVSFHMERVLDLRERTNQLFGLVQAEDAILLIAAADVVAGIDLGELREGDLEISPDRKSVRVLLPPPRVLSARLDNDRTYVHTRSTDTLAARSDSLETKARQAAEQTLRQAALDAGILTRARSTAARTVEGLLRSLGFEQVETSFREE
jgi:hypothetical protein